MKHLTRIVLPDVHFPFEDTNLVGAWLDHVKALKPDGIDIIGDLIDCYSLSRFDKNPARKSNLQVELDQANHFLLVMRKYAGRFCDIRYSEGNHEDRLRKVLWNKIPGMNNIRNLTIPGLLNLKKLGISWHSTQNPYKIRDLWYTHGDMLRQSAGMSGRAMSDKIHGSVILGHCHRMGWSPRTTWNGREDAYEVGHLTDYTQLDYVRSVPNWQQGWAVVEFLEGGGHVVSFATVHQQGRKRIVVYKGEVIG